MKRSHGRSTLIATVVLAGCAATAVKTPQPPDARAVVHWRCSASGDDLDGDSGALWNWYMMLALPDDDVECEFRLASDPRLAEGGWIDPSEPPPIEPAPPSPNPPNGRVPRAAAERLVSLRDSAHGRPVTLDVDDVVMKWALPFLRTELAKSASR
jgi:hypothetical protein